jgi:hypothetical protein
LDIVEYLSLKFGPGESIKPGEDKSSMKKKPANL